MNASRTPILGAIVASICAALTATPAAAQDDPLRLADELFALQWGRTCAAWAADLGGAACVERTGAMYSTRVRDEWCYEGVAPGRVGTPLFHALWRPGPAACELEQYVGSVEVDSASMAAGHAELVGRIDARLGPHEAPAEVRGELGSAYWSDVRTWSSDTLYVIAYSDRYPLRPPRVALIARHGPLLAAAREEGGRRRYPLAELEEEVGRAAFPVLAARDSALAEWTFGDAWRPIGPGDFAEGYLPALAATLAAAERASDDTQAALLFAADRLAARVTRRLEPDVVRDTARGGVTQPEIDSLRALGLSVTWAPLGRVWAYEHDLLRQVWEEHPQSPWGERAFLLMLARGWNMASACGAGSDTFRPVIEHGEAFLAERPASPYRRAVTFAVALAYETWWSLGRARDDTYVPAPERYLPGSERARQRAAELYRELEAGEDEAASWARRQLPRVELGVDTGQRRFFCIYD